MAKASVCVYSCMSCVDDSYAKVVFPALVEWESEKLLSSQHQQSDNDD